MVYTPLYVRDNRKGEMKTRKAFVPAQLRMEISLCWPWLHFMLFILAMAMAPLYAVSKKGGPLVFSLLQELLLENPKEISTIYFAIFKC